jgi:CRISPR-associated protein Csd1
MSWMQKLYETYDKCSGNRDIPDIGDLFPVGYSAQEAHVEVVIDVQGNIRRATLVPKDQAKTLIPVTEKSLTGRTSGIAPHPLCESLQYCAADYPKYHGIRASYFDCSDFNESEFVSEKVGTPLELINKILLDSNKPAKRRMSKKKCFRWLNLYLTLVNRSGNEEMQSRRSSNRLRLEQEYSQYCPVNAASYFRQLERWVNSPISHSKARAVYVYISKGCLVRDLISQGLLAVDGDVLCVRNKDNAEATETHPLMKLLSFDDNGIKDQAKVFVRWSVEGDGLCSHTWEDKSLFDAWSKYSSLFDSEPGFCCVTGANVTLAAKHPAKLRSGKDGAKLISSNDNDGYTFLGRLTESAQVTGVSSEVTQKAHSALRWLIGRKQAFKNGDQVFVAWAVIGKDIPDPMANSWDFLEEPDESENSIESLVTDVGQNFALRLRRKIAGYAAGIRDSEDIVVMGLDSASKGRMAIIYYRELTGSEFLERIERWHESFAWMQNYGKDCHFIGAPAPKEIAWAAFGKKVEGKNGTKLLGSTVERLFPCIIDGAPLPRDLMVSAVRRASNRSGLEHWEWEKCLGIACALYRGINQERSYRMELEDGRNSRDYLYGRLLAVAEKIEAMALRLAGEPPRPTTAARLMQRFADRPFSTWRTIETALVPYMSRIQARMPGLVEGYRDLLDAVHVKLRDNGYEQDARLNGEYLLGYHCQRAWFKSHKRDHGKWVEKKPDEPENSDGDTVLTNEQ